MDKKDIYSKLEDISGRLEDMLKDESIESFPEAFNRVKDDFNDFLNELEESISEDKLNETSVERPKY